MELMSIVNIAKRDAEIVERLNKAYHNEAYRGPNEGALREILGHAVMRQMRHDDDYCALAGEVISELPAKDIAWIAKKAIEPEEESWHDCAVCGNSMSSKEYEEKGCIFCGADSEEDE